LGILLHPFEWKSLKIHRQKGGLAMKKNLFYLILFLGVVLLAPAYAATQAEEVLKAVVKIRAVIPEGARTEAVLGTEREGHGIVFITRITEGGPAAEVGLKTDNL
jgi:hypothetical protein